MKFKKLIFLLSNLNVTISSGLSRFLKLLLSAVWQTLDHFAFRPLDHSVQKPRSSFFQNRGVLKFNFYSNLQISIFNENFKIFNLNPYHDGQPRELQYKNDELANPNFHYRSKPLVVRYFDIHLRIFQLYYPAQLKINFKIHCFFKIQKNLPSHK